MEKTIRQEMKVTWVLKALMAAYVVTGLLLLLLTLLVYKMEFSEEKVTAGITAIYVLSTFVDEYFDVVPALCGRWNGGWNDFLKESLLNLTCM